MPPEFGNADRIRRLWKMASALDFLVKFAEN
jgi:hypothetical protein